MAPMVNCEDNHRNLIPSCGKLSNVLCKLFFYD